MDLNKEAREQIEQMERAWIDALHDLFKTDKGRELENWPPLRRFVDAVKAFGEATGTISKQAVTAQSVAPLPGREAIREFAHDFCRSWATTFSSHDSVAIIIELREALEMFLHGSNDRSKALDQSSSPVDDLVEDIMAIYLSHESYFNTHGGAPAKRSANFRARLKEYATKAKTGKPANN